MTFKYLSRTGILLFMIFGFSFTALAGGSSVRVYETNVRDKALQAGANDQLLMSFRVEPGNIQINNFDLHCVPSSGLEVLNLVQDGNVIDSTRFSPTVGTQRAHFGPDDFVLPAGVETEFELRVGVNANAPSQIISCAIDDLTFKNVEDGTLYDSGYQAIDFPGIKKLMYIENPSLDIRDEDFFVIKPFELSQDLALNSKDNKLATFGVLSSKETKLQDLFVSCSGGSILKNFSLKIGSQVIKPADEEVDWYTDSRPEFSSNKKIVFSNLNKLFGPGPEMLEMSLYADTYDYFSFDPGTWPKCDVLDVMATNNETFKDVSRNNRFYAAIQFLYEKGIVHGYADGTFHPKQAVNRAEFLKMLLDAKQLNVDASQYHNCFSDVQDQWFAAPVCYAKSQGWVKGYSSKIFKPDAEIGSAEALKMLFESQGIKVDPVISGPWYANYLHQAVASGLVSADNLDPAKIMSRGDAAEYLYGVLK